MPRPDTKELARKVKAAGGAPPKVDYWMLQANIFMQQVKDAVEKAIKEMPKTAEGRAQLQAIAQRNRDKISEQDISDYQELLRIMSNRSVDAKIRGAISQAMFEVPDVAGDAFKVLEVLEALEALDTNPQEGENTLAKHKRLLKTYTTSSPTSSLMTNPNGGKDRMFSVSGVDYDPMGAGRIPYGYTFHDGGHDGRQIPISTGTPVKHSGGSAFGMHLVGTANIGKNASVHGSFHSYLDGVCSGGKEDAPSYGSGVVGKEKYPQEDGELDYVYINLQKHDADITGSGKRERIAESVRSDALYREINSYSKAACLTLPADNKFFWQGFDRHTASGDGSRATSESMIDEIAKSISEKKNDFIIPDKILKKMYKAKEMDIPDNLRDQAYIKELVRDSFKDAVKGITGNDDLIHSLDSETRSAVMLHFVKATFTDQILNATNPKRFNITCKDAIDRAGTHNLWLQIHRKLSAEPRQTIEKAEVERFLDGLAMAYKHRPANEHRDAFINAMGKFYANLDDYKTDI